MLKRMIPAIFALVLAAGLFPYQPGHSSAAPANPFGPNVYIFDPSMSASSIQSTVDSIFTKQETNQFGSERYALLFAPGTYNVNVRVGFYTHVAGLGQNPGDVNITGGVNVDAKWANGNATQNFWRSIENLTITPSSGKTQFAVSQAAPMRRTHVVGAMDLFDFDSNWNAGWASGGYLADSIVDGKITPASQQQWFNRNSQYGGWGNGVWNMVFVGDANPPAASFPNPPYTVVANTPVIREKPYLYMNNAGQYYVFVPSLATNRKGVSWATGSTPGQSISIDQFYIAQPGTATASSINNALSQGKHLLFTPGIYHLNDTIRITNPNTVVLGLGLPTLIPDNGQAAMTVADVDGVKIAGLLFDAGPNNSPSMLEVGPAGSSNNHSANPTSLHDLYFRVGGAGAGKNDACLKINSNHVIGDHFWIWRADHGTGVGWTTNVSTNGMIVNGNNVTVYGLFNEHHNQYQTLWNGNGGRVYFYQSEIPYDVPSQSAWMSQNGAVNGYASYKVAKSVTSHEAWGVGVYSFFRDAPVKLESAIEVPNVQGVKIHNMTTIWLSGMAGSEITHVINNTGGRVYANSPSDAMRQTVSEFQGTGTGTGDTQAPSAPANLAATAVSASQINLTWTASTDNVGVTGYDVYRNGSLAGSATSTSYSDTGLAASTTYSYTVKARDAAGNVSAASNTASATTQSGGGTETALDRTGWTITTSPVNGTPANMIDGDMTTRWTTGTDMVSGQYFIVDMKSPKAFSKIVMDSTGNNNDYARGYQVFVSNDGTNWGSAVASGTGTGPVVTVSFAAQTARYIKVVQTGSATNWWSIREFNVYTSGGTGAVLDRTGWTASTSPVNSTPANMLDGITSTRWTTGTAMVSGQYVVVDMKASKTFNKIVMDSTGSNNDYARGYEVYVSGDGTNWGSAVASGTGSGPVITVNFAAKTARYIKVVQTGSASNWWSIHEFNVYY
ncbi:fibronectin type III domain-containing protein [Cohnella pontilimi]|uniref:Fibronectin type III domain-containing protein n=1 Tax=Cohnella pontilimi TaxID=2564100 RepID=A0A4V6WED2_9BACL|nr:discoidin domain-containing protein [Cohnella pontilimi]TJY38259.1 fibronectin type III domain-containing protein [Cohnella pontilimi]